MGVSFSGDIRKQIVVMVAQPHEYTETIELYTFLKEYLMVGEFYLNNTVIFKNPKLM